MQSSAPVISLCLVIVRHSKIFYPSLLAQWHFWICLLQKLILSEGIWRKIDFQDISEGWQKMFHQIVISSLRTTFKRGSVRYQQPTPLHKKQKRAAAPAADMATTTTTTTIFRAKNSYNIKNWCKKGSKNFQQPHSTCFTFSDDSQLRQKVNAKNANMLFDRYF